MAHANDGSVYSALARMKAHSRKCATAASKLMGEKANATAEYHLLLSHVSTTDVARDLAAVLDLMGEASLKYWGSATARTWAVCFKACSRTGSRGWPKMET